MLQEGEVFNFLHQLNESDFTVKFYGGYFKFSKVFFFLSLETYGIPLRHLQP